MARGKGRPTTYTQKLADEICEQLALGKSMRTVCAMDGMPAMSSVFKWLREVDNFSEQYAKAKQESTDAMAEELVDISDNENMADTQRARLRIDTRKWLMAKMKPKKYGDQLDLTTKGERIVVMPAELIAKNAINTSSGPEQDSI